MCLPGGSHGRECCEKTARKYSSPTPFLEDFSKLLSRKPLPGHSEEYREGTVREPFQSSCRGMHLQAPLAPGILSPGNSGNRWQERGALSGAHLRVCDALSTWSHAPPHPSSPLPSTLRLSILQRESGDSFWGEGASISPISCKSA